jgi:hypothetical protein
VLAFGGQVLAHERGLGVGGGLWHEGSGYRGRDGWICVQKAGETLDASL